MLTSNSILKSFPTALLLAEKGLVVKTKPNTLLETLVRDTNNGTSLMGEAITFGENNSSFNSWKYTSPLEALATFYEETTKGTIQDNEVIKSQHDLTLDDIETKLAPLIKNHINFAKNVVKPLISDYITNVTNDITNYSPQDPSTRFEIRQLDLPKPLYNPMFSDSLSIYEGRASITPVNYPKLDSKSAEEIAALLQTLDSSVDQAIVEWIYNKHNDGFLSTVWNSFFYATETYDDGKDYTSFDLISKMNVFEKVDYYLAVYLLANKLFDDTSSSNGNMSLGEYRIVLGDLRDYAGIELTKAIKFVKSYDVLNTIVINVDDKEQLVEVYGINYRSWLTTGGTPEVILGIIVSGKNVKNRASIDEAAIELAEEWKRYCYVSNSNTKVDRFEFFKKTLYTQFTYSYLMQTLTEKEIEFSQNNSTYKEKVYQYLDLIIDSLEIKDMDNLPDVCIKIICRSRFFYTDSEKILRGINQAEIDNPGINIREAALISVIWYIADFVADQLSAVRV